MNSWFKALIFFLCICLLILYIIWGVCGGWILRDMFAWWSHPNPDSVWDLHYPTIKRAREFLSKADLSLLTNIHSGNRKEWSGIRIFREDRYLICSKLPLLVDTHFSGLELHFHFAVKVLFSKFSNLRKNLKFTVVLTHTKNLICVFLLFSICAVEKLFKLWILPTVAG